MQPLPRGELCLEGRWAGRSDASWGECRPLTCVILHAVWTDSLHVNYSKCVVDSFGCKLLLEKTVAYLSPGRLFPVVDVAVVLSSVVVCCALFVWWCVDIIWWLHHLVISEDASCQIFCPLLISHKVLPDIVVWGGNGGCGHVLGQRGDGSCKDLPLPGSLRLCKGDLLSPASRCFSQKLSRRPHPVYQLL